MLPIHLQGLRFLCPTVHEEMHLQENTLFDLDLGVKVSQNVAQYLLHHVTYLGTKFEAAMSKGLGGDTFTRNVTDIQTDGPTLVRNYYTLFSKEKSGYNNTKCVKQKRVQYSHKTN